MDRKKLFTIFVVVITVALVALGIFYFFFLRGEGETEPGTFPTTTPSKFPPLKPPLKPPVDTEPTTGEPGAFRPILRQITTVPTSSGIAFERDGKKLIRYIERGRGNVYETDAEKIKAERLTNTTIPKIYEAYFKSDGSSVIARTLKEETEEIRTFYGKVQALETGAGTGELLGGYLTNNIRQMSVSPSTSKIFFLLSTDSGTIGIASNFDGSKGTQVFESPLNGWLTDWPKEDTVALASKPSFDSTGVTIFLNPTTGKTSTILSNIRGLTSKANATAEKIFLSESTDSNFDSFIFTINGALKTQSPLRTLPEKCVWSKKEKDVIFCAVPQYVPEATYPDSWYQSTVSFKDEIWKLDTKTSRSEFIMNLKDRASRDFDVINPSLSASESFLLLTNKNDLTLWELQIAP